MIRSAFHFSVLEGYNGTIFAYGQVSVHAFAAVCVMAPLHITVANGFQLWEAGNHAILYAKFTHAAENYSGLCKFLTCDKPHE